MPMHGDTMCSGIALVCFYNVVWVQEVGLWCVYKRISCPGCLGYGATHVGGWVLINWPRCGFSGGLVIGLFVEMFSSCSASPLCSDVWGCLGVLGCVCV